MVPILGPHERHQTVSIYTYDLIDLFYMPHVNPFRLRISNHQFLSKYFKHIHPFQQVINNSLFSYFLLFSSIFSYFHNKYFCYYRSVSTYPNLP